MKEMDLAAELERRFNFVEGSITSVVQKCVEKGVKHDQLNRILTHIILNRQPYSPPSDT